MSPRGKQRSSDRGLKERLKYAVVESDLGLIAIATGERGIASILFGDDRAVLLRELVSRFPEASLSLADRMEDDLVRVVQFVQDPRHPLGLPLDIRGTAFQRLVWTALMEIPAGATASYADIARRIGAPAGVRAVAGACSRNVLAVAIPCHRVLRHDGSISGYAWGVARKRALLDREGRFVNPDPLQGRKR